MKQDSTLFHEHVHTIDRHAKTNKNEKRAKHVYDKHLNMLNTLRFCFVSHCDVLLLADVLGNFMKTCLAHYRIHPASDLTAQFLAWDA